MFEQASRRGKWPSLRSVVAGRRGVTLTELMVATVVLTIGVVGSMGTFKYIAGALRLSRIRTIANNLAQEEIESLKNTPYAMLLVTTSTVNDANFNPAVVYDAANYPPKTITMWGGAPLTRAVYVSYAAPFGNSISTIPATSTDPGLKLITVYVLWNQDGQWRKMSLTNLLENPDVAALDSSVAGTVTKSDSGAPPLAGALVQVLGSPNWRAFTDSSGNYSFSVTHGSYTITASSAGYYARSSSLISADAGAAAVQNFSLAAIGTGTIASASVYVDSGLLVSQVVADTRTQAADGDVHDIEYVELFNPTTHSIVINGATPLVQLNVVPEGGSGAGTNIPLTYASASAPPKSYYLIANATDFFVLGQWTTADAYYTSLYSHVIWNGVSPSAGAVRLEDASAAIIDGVGWSHTGSGKLSPWSEGSAVPQSGGLQAGDQIVRMSGACVVDANYGRAYDTNDNGSNFTYNTGSPGLLTFPPGNAAVSKPVVSGVPALGGWLSLNDGLSAAIPLTTSVAVRPAPYNQSCPYASFSLSGAATGTWTALVSTGIYSQTIDNVAVTQGAITQILNSATSPPDPTGFNYLPIASQTTGGYVSGSITDAAGAPLSGITVYGGLSSTLSGSTGLYFTAASTGAVTLAANPNQQNPLYISQTSLANVQTGLVTALNFTLSQGGTLEGYIANTDLSALPGIVVNATNAGNGSVGSAVADGTGHFYIPNLSTGTYSVAPVIDATQSSTPASAPSVALTGAGSSVFAGTFTITGGFATISGSVLDNGQAITTGALIVASSVTITDPPPPISASNAASIPPYYSISSQANGTYSLPVRGSGSYTYNLSAFYPRVDPNTGATSYTRKSLSGLSVAPGAVLSGQNFTWP